MANLIRAVPSNSLKAIARVRHCIMKTNPTVGLLQEYCGKPTIMNNRSGDRYTRFMIITAMHNTKYHACMYPYSISNVLGFNDVYLMCIAPYTPMSAFACSMGMHPFMSFCKSSFRIVNLIQTFLASEF